MQDALDSNAWVRDIRGGLSAAAFVEYLQLWDILADFELHPGIEDQHIWTPSSTGEFSTQSAYRSFLVGAVAVLNRCWTADRLARRGLEHPEHCLLCDQEEENMQHLRTSCAFARTVWISVLRMDSLQQHALGLSDNIFVEWWRQATQQVPRHSRKGFNSLVVLVAWWIWKHKNMCVFKGASPSLDNILSNVKDEARLWCMAGAKGLRSLWP
ncbi:hypothetical protein U9M48_042709 [Paspalum notatum var. saurae]|uniref:Reverse transcriptase zinc-binding domain-containing protein n=1 Tax=Paspalum notatum var. saurae TaxID=547442 RepID=A0AAQ3URD6_PASNO